MNIESYYPEKFLLLMKNALGNVERWKLLRVEAGNISLLSQSILVKW
jgi:hypothetical protein